MSLVRAYLLPLVQQLKDFIDLVAPRIDTSELTAAEQETWHAGVHAVKSLCDLMGVK